MGKMREIPPTRGSTTPNPLKDIAKTITETSFHSPIILAKIHVARGESDSPWYQVVFSKKSLLLYPFSCTTG